jgi:hypothetical protein
VVIAYFNPLKPKLVYITFKNSVRTAKKTQHVTVTKINRLTLFKDIIAVYSENRTKRINTKWGKNAELLNVKAVGTYSYHCVVNGSGSFQQFFWRIIPGLKSG